MKKLAYAASALAISISAFGLAPIAQTALAQPTEAASVTETQAVVDAANAFLATLTADQKSAVQFDFTPLESASAATFERDMSTMPENGRPTPPSGEDMQNMPTPDGGNMAGGPPAGGMPGFGGEQYGEAVWSNFPVSDVPRPGLELGELNAEQREAAMALLKTVLSPMGYQKIIDIMASDEVLSKTGQNAVMGEDVYTLGLFGTPSATAPFMIEFGGHHLGLNIVIAQNHGVMTPTLTGAQPAQFERDGQTVRVLAEENDKAFELINALDEAQRETAVLDYEVGNLVAGPGAFEGALAPEGLKASEMTDDQRNMLLDLVAQWAGIVNEAYSSQRMDEIKEDLDETYFAWSGPLTHEENRNGKSYYRIQGPKLLIEFSPQGVGGDLTNHVHTVYRDPTNEYGHLYTLAQ